MMRETDTNAFVLVCDLADHFKPLREHLCDVADSKGVELFWDCIEAVRKEMFGPAR
jgi:hypothetical protein